MLWSVWPTFNLFCDSDCLRRGSHEVVNAVSLCFKNDELEELYRDYQYELASNTINGKVGSLSLTSIYIIVTALTIWLKNTASLLKQYTSGSIERMISMVPVAVFGFYHQYRLHSCSRTNLTRRQFQNFVLQFAVLHAITELNVIYVNDSFPQYEGCPAHRFRCPYSFSSSKFCSRIVTVAAMTVFHLTPCHSLLGIVQLLVILCVVNRTIGLFVFHESFSTSLWSVFCTNLQIAIFVCCRYVQELQDRKRFLLQLHIARLRTNFQEVLDSMTPRSVLERLKAGQLVIDPCDSAVVLLCSFPPDAPNQQDLMQAYALVDRVHQVVAETDLLRGNVAESKQRHRASIRMKSIL
jgi:hypothetical protein